jgi:DedD protein
MASPPITETNEIRRRGRQRLIGAIALVALLVVFVPMLLDSEPRKPRTQPALAIPSKDEAPPLPAPPKAGKTAVDSPKAVPEPAKGAQQPAKTAAAPAKVEPAKVEPAKVEAAKAEPAKAATAKATQAEPPRIASVDAQGAAATPRLEGFAVQVGAFRDEAKLTQARQKLVAARIPHYTERLDAQSGPLTRLRAGPFATREAAEAALASVKLSALDGKVVSLP